MKKYNPHLTPPPLPQDKSIKYKLCPGHPGYAISNTGTVLSYRQSGHWKKRKLLKTESGYLVVDLEDQKTHKVHRLVLKAFVGPCPKGMECRHLDGNQTNNNLNNLRWGTRQENMDDKKRRKKTCNTVLTESHVNFTLTKYTVIQLRKLEGLTLALIRYMRLVE